jgi:tRNA A37 threonylcarbamoyladenosine dehydratase
MNSGSLDFARAGWFAADGISARAPELDPLHDRTIAQFGVGCLGGPSSLEFPRTGIGELRILDEDLVDPATIGRWPFGLNAAGLPKVQVIAKFIGENYPSTRVIPVQHRLGARRGTQVEARSDHEVIEQMTAGTSILFDATA